LRLEEIREIERKTRTVLTTYKMRHQTVDINKLYAKREGEGKGLLQIEATYRAEIISIVEYLNTKYTEDQFVNIVKSHESSQPNMNSTIKMASKVAEELNENCGTKRKAFHT
jgi:hypothetical protein